ncbi:hypothetical protein ACLVWU_17555 [Bdellovibrio sp. HCB290]|uniref:hypothetical protein n=1 Tax=Bdellovibrio sp. HCB290 TaxID=3394356 RepID=UPI0039B5181D
MKFDAFDEAMHPEVVKRIIRLNMELAKFWSNARGWAPQEAADMLEKSRLDWQVSLSHRLSDVLREHPKEESDAKLIESWLRLGVLVENSMKLGFVVFLRDYRNSKPEAYAANKLTDPDSLKFDKLRELFVEHLSTDPGDDEWLRKIQHQRNAIHAFKDRSVNDWRAYKEAVFYYLRFLRRLSERLPYPDEMYAPHRN